MNRLSGQTSGLLAFVASYLRSANWKQWLPSRGNFVFVVIITLALIWAQSSGVFARGTALQSTGFTRPIPYQGRLADASGNPLTNTYPMIFRLYSGGTGGVPLWEENWSGPNSVQVSDGLFSVMLGSLIPIPESIVTTTDTLWLGITVGTDDEMSPRIQIGTVPYSHLAQSVPDGSITAAKLAEGAVPPGVPVGTVISWWRKDATTPLPSDEWKIADGTVVTDAASPLDGSAVPDLRNRFVMGVGESQIGTTGGANTLNLSHQHQVDNHVHYVPDHAHGDGELHANVSVEDDRAYVKRYGPGFNASNANYTNGSHANSHQTDASADVNGITAYWGGNSGGSAPMSSFNLSASTDNRPAYYGLIYLIRIK